MSIESNTLKVIIVGDAGVGKSSLVKQFCFETFSEERKVTIGVDFGRKKIRINGKEVTVDFWDTAGQERFSNMTRVYYKDAHAAFVVCDKSSAASLASVSVWKSDIDNKVTYPDKSPIPAILLANKCDLPDGCTDEDINAKVRECGFEAAFLTSAKEKIGFEDAVNVLVQKIFEKLAMQQPAPVASPPVTFVSQPPIKQNACSC